MTGYVKELRLEIKDLKFDHKCDIAEIKGQKPPVREEQKDEKTDSFKSDSKSNSFPSDLERELLK